MTAGAKGGGGKKSTPPGVNPFASSDLMALRSKLPSKPELDASANTGKGGAGENAVVRLSEAEAIAALGGKGGGAMRAERKAKGSKQGGGGGGGDNKNPANPGSIGSGVGASKGVEPALQAGGGHFVIL